MNIEDKAYFGKPTVFLVGEIVEAGNGSVSHDGIFKGRVVKVNPLNSQGKQTYEVKITQVDKHTELVNKIGDIITVFEDDLDYV